jgi:predicted nuclease of restriction endonuclease-like (RecB) superfamily
MVIRQRTSSNNLLNQTNFDKALPEKYNHQAKLAVKDEYTFDFLELGVEHSERELEIEILNNIRRFLIEMGGYLPLLVISTELKSRKRNFSWTCFFIIESFNAWLLLN